MDIEDLDSIVSQLSLIGIYGTLYQNTYLAQCKFFFKHTWNIYKDRTYSGP